MTILDNPPPGVKAMQNLANVARQATSSQEARTILGTISREFAEQGGLNYEAQPDASGLEVTVEFKDNG